MNEMFSQGGKGSTGILTNKQAIARKFGVKQNEVVYFSVGVDLGGYKVIYDKSTQRAYSLPANLGSGVTAVSLSTAGVLVHSAGSVDLGALAVTREEYVTLPGSFDTGVTINAKNELVVFTDGKYRWDGALPKEVPADSNPTSTGGVGPSAWVSVGDASLRSELFIDWVGGLGFEASHGQPTIVSSFYKNNCVGGGVFIYDESKPRSEHNGITIISPDIKFNNIVDWLKIDGSRTGSGCWVKQIQGDTITSDECGAIPDGDDPVELPYFEKLSQIELMKSYKVGKDVGTDNYPMLQAMLDLPITNKIITTVNGCNYRITRPLEYSANTIITAIGAHVFASKLFGAGIEKEARMLLKSKRAPNVFINHAKVIGGRWDGCYRYYTYHENALSRSISVGFTSGKPDPVAHKMWSTFECYNMTDFELHNVDSAFSRYMNDDVHSVRSYYFKCKSYYMEDDCYTSSSSGNITSDNRKSYGLNLTYDSCEAWFAGFTSGGGSSGFEIDDGPDKALYINCKTYFCPRGFNQHVHPYAEHTNTPSRNNYVYNSCSVYTSYIDLDYSPASGSQGHGAFTIGGGDLNGVVGFKIIACHIEDNVFNDFLFGVAQVATTKPVSGLSIIGCTSTFTEDLSYLADMYGVSSREVAAVNITMEMSGKAAYANGVTMSNCTLDGGGFKQAIFFRGGSDITIDRTNTFKNFGTIGRVVSPSNTSGFANTVVIKAKFIEFSQNASFNTTLLRVEGGYIFDADGVMIDSRETLDKYHTIISCTSALLKLSDVVMIGNGKQVAINKGSNTKSIIKGGYYKNVSYVNTTGKPPTVGEISDNILEDSAWGV